jgi:hypothetical protein
LDWQSRSVNMHAGALDWQSSRSNGEAIAKRQVIDR